MCPIFQSLWQRHIRTVSTEIVPIYQRMKEWIQFTPGCQLLTPLRSDLLPMDLMLRVLRKVSTLLLAGWENNIENHLWLIISICWLPFNTQQSPPSLVRVSLWLWRDGLMEPSLGIWMVMPVVVIIIIWETWPPNVLSVGSALFNHFGLSKHQY